MYFRKKIRRRVLIVLVIVLAVIFWRGLKATTKNDFKCEYKIIYAFCTAKKVNANSPGIWDIFKAGVDF
jgi:hypothetical protein